MRNVRINERYGQFEAVVNGRKKQFRNVETGLIKYLETNYPGDMIADAKLSVNEPMKMHITLESGAIFDYETEYALGEELEVNDNENVRIRITGIEIQRLCNADAKEVLNEGFFREKVDGYMQYCYRDKENDNKLCHYFTHPQCLISFLYKTMRQETVLENPYSVVYKFEKANG